MRRTVEFAALALAAVAVAFVPAIRVSAAADADAPQHPTFNCDIAPIVYQYCSSCHRPGEAAPFSLLTYQDVKKHANQIVAVTHTRFMPPWPPEPNKLKFADERRLTDAQIALIQRWAEQGAPEGRASDLPPKPQFTEGWQLGKPDIIVQAAKPYELPATGTDRYWNFILPIPVNETRWVKAVEIRPGDKRLVHHANILVDRLQSARAMEKEPGAGYGGMELRIESEAFDPDSHFLFWKPGTVPYVEPDGMALRVDPGTDFVLNAHLQPSGKPELIQPSIGVYFTDKPATRHPMLLEMENDAALDIPAGNKYFVVTDEFTLPVDVDLLAIYPHLHYLGKDAEASARLPDGTTETLIRIKHWDVNWQAVYRYAEPVRLPRGSVISMRYVYDNSEENIANPNHPPKQVLGGNRSTDEMAHLWLQVLPVNQTEAKVDPRRVLQEALSRHEIEKNPANFEAQYNLAAMLQARGEVRDAIPHFEAALQMRPSDPIVNNALGGVLLSTGHVSEAEQHFRAALQSRPGYFDAHYNLGTVLVQLGDFPGAEAQFREAERINPNDAGAQMNLGTTLAELGKLSEAREHLQRALQLKPDSEIARENLTEVEKMLQERQQ